MSITCSIAPQASYDIYAPLKSEPFSEFNLASSVRNQSHSPLFLSMRSWKVIEVVAKIFISLSSLSLLGSLITAQVFALSHLTTSVPSLIVLIGSVFSKYFASSREFWSDPEFKCIKLEKAISTIRRENSSESKINGGSEIKKRFKNEITHCKLEEWINHYFDEEYCKVSRKALPSGLPWNLKKNFDGSKYNPNGWNGFNRKYGLDISATASFFLPATRNKIYLDFLADHETLEAVMAQKAKIITLFGARANAEIAVVLADQLFHGYISYQEFIEKLGSSNLALLDENKLTLIASKAKDYYRKKLPMKLSQIYSQELVYLNINFYKLFEEEFSVFIEKTLLSAPKNASEFLDSLNNYLSSYGFQFGKSPTQYEPSMLMDQNLFDYSYGLSATLLQPLEELVLKLIQDPQFQFLHLGYSLLYQDDESFLKLCQLYPSELHVIPALKWSEFILRNSHLKKWILKWANEHFSENHKKSVLNNTQISLLSHLQLDSGLLHVYRLFNHQLPFAKGCYESHYQEFISNEIAKLRQKSPTYTLMNFFIRNGYEGYKMASPEIQKELKALYSKHSDFDIKKFPLIADPITYILKSKSLDQLANNEYNQFSKRFNDDKTYCIEQVSFQPLAPELSPSPLISKKINNLKNISLHNYLIKTKKNLIETKYLQQKKLFEVLHNKQVSKIDNLHFLSEEFEDFIKEQFTKLLSELR
jgi:hypothetical protein